MYTSEAAAYLPDALVDDGNEVESAFRPVAEVRQLALAAAQRLFLDAALSRSLTSTRASKARCTADRVAPPDDVRRGGRRSGRARDEQPLPEASP